MPEDLRLAPLLDAVGRLRHEAWNETVALVRSERFTGWLLDAAAAAERRVWREALRNGQEEKFIRPAVELAREALKHRLHKAKKRARHLSKLDLPERHKLRIALKKLRYAADFFASLFPGKQLAPYLKQLGRVQDSFGAMNDAAMTLHVLERIRGDVRVHDAEQSEAAAFIAGWHLSRLDPMWREARKRWKRLVKQEPFWAT
jgi:CHAD domain-containing protein